MQTGAVTPEMLTASPDEAVAGFNTRDGLNALTSLTTGTFNTAIGFNALMETSTGSHNTGVGAQTLLNNEMGNFNTAIGENALVFNQSGSENMALGQGALANNGVGSNNTAMGFQALNSNVVDDNTAVGFQALVGLTGGSGNTAVGNQAGHFLTTGSDNIYLGSPGNAAAESGWIRIGPDTFGPTVNTTSKTASGGIFGKTVGTSLPVLINVDGQLGTMVSSARFKKDIDPMGKSSEVIFSLRPVTFHYRGDETNVPNFGLIAEEVAKVNPDLILLDKEGKPLTVRYEEINAMLLNEFLKEHRKVEQLEKQIAALTAGLQKVSAQLELRKPSPQTVLNNP